VNCRWRERGGEEQIADGENAAEKNELQWRRKQINIFFFSLYFFILFLLTGKMFSLSIG
jgi:hypothetical protein